MAGAAEDYRAMGGEPDARSICRRTGVVELALIVAVGNPRGMGDRVR